MSVESNQLKLYSLTEAAAVMAIGRDTLRSLLADGKIGFILVGRSKKIPYQELIRFQTESLVRQKQTQTNPTLSNAEINNLITRSVRRPKSNIDSKQILKDIIRNDNNGNSKKKRKDSTRSMV